MTQPIPTHTAWLKRVGLCLLIPAAIVALLPAVLLVVAALYVAAAYHGVRIAFRSILGKQDPPEFAKPHFLESAYSVAASQRDADSAT